jgi:lysine 6-dehydrogenase
MIEISTSLAGEVHMGYQYAIIGAGRQGTASAYDLARFGEAERIIMADIDMDQATQAADRINQLIGRPLSEGKILDAGNKDAVTSFLLENEIDALIGATPYFLNYELTQAAITAGAGMTDLGGNSDIVFRQLALRPEAEAAGISIVPDCGQVPGMGTTLILYALEQLDEALDAYMWDCGLPMHPQPPWNYKLTFNIEGLTNEYFGDCLLIRDGKTVVIPTLEEYETIEFPEPLGKLEAFTTSGGLTSAARSFSGKLRTLQNKTLRYPGNFAQLKLMQQLGLLELEPITVDGQQVIPRHVLHTLWDPQIRADIDTRDLIFIHIIARGLKDGQEMEAQVDLLHFFDEETGFTAMEQGTGWHASILTAAIARGEVQKGVIPVEEAMSGTTFVEHAALRGFNVTVEVRPSTSGG